MKLFAIIFAAILAAAAVIAGVIAIKVSRDRYAADRLRSLELMADIAKTTDNRLTIGGTLDRVSKEIVSSNAKDFEMILREGRVDRGKAQGFTSDFIFYSREVVKNVREHTPEEKVWADEIDQLLTKVEETSRGM